ncbi:MAG: hypothetical protein WC773_01975 [Patescibacteria group bacterium]
MEEQPKKSNAILWIVIVVLLLVIFGGGVWWFLSNNSTTTTSSSSSSPSPTATPVVLSEQPNLDMFNQYLSSSYLSKLAVGEQVGPNNTTKTTTFNFTTDQFCVNMTARRTIESGHIAMAIYSLATKTNVVDKVTAVHSTLTGGNTSCEPESLTTGKYELKMYYDNTLISVLPFSAL